MKMLTRRSISAVAVLSLWAMAPFAHAQIAFNVTLNTAPLVGSPNGPFFVDFQLIDGSGAADANNTVTLSNFQFGGGSAVGGATLTGGAAGDIATTATLTDTDFFNDLVQEFTSGTFLSFDVNMTTNVDAGGTPDAFSFALLDGNGFNIPTFGGGFFVTVDIDSATPVIVSFAADDPYRDIGLPDITVLNGGGNTVPEPGGLALLCGLAAPAVFVLRQARRRR